MFTTPRTFKALSTRLALGLSLLSLSSSLLPVLAAPGDVNSTNNGQTINAGVYYNTPGSKTTFQNTNGTGLFLQAGDLVRGLESSGAGNPTGNGGTLHFNAPGQMVRLDGNVDISGIIKNGVYQGNGGSAFIDAAVYYQNGNLFANGLNGGNFQFNVGSAMFGPGAQVQAMGAGGGLGGNIAVNASGGVDIAPGVVLDSSGRNLFTYDRNLINIEGGFINNEGIIRANSVVINDGHRLAIANSESSAAVLEATEANKVDGPASFVREDAFTRGGTVRLVASGLSRQDCFDCVVDKATATETNPFSLAVGEALLNLSEANALKSRFDFLVKNFDADIRNINLIQAQGNLQHNAGTVLGAAARNIFNSGIIQANGYTGGTVGLSARQDIRNAGVLQANSATYRVNIGLDGQDTLPVSQGGLVAASYGRQFNNIDGMVQANGVPGGLIVFSGPSNPFGGRAIAAYNSGVIVAPDSNALVKPDYFASAYDDTRNDELLIRNENLLLLSRGNDFNDLPGHVNNALVRSVSSRLGGATDELTRGVYDRFTNLFVGSTGTNTLRVTRPRFFNDMTLDTKSLNTFVINHNGGLTRFDNGHWYIGRHEDANGQYTYSPLGGRYSMLAQGNINNDHSQVFSFGHLSGGSIHLASTTADIINDNGGDWQTRVVRQENTYSNVGGIGGLYGGSIIAKAGGSIINQGQASYSTNPIDLKRPNMGGKLEGLFGGSIQMLASYFLNTDGSAVTAGSRVRDIDGENLNAQGGSITIKAINNVINNGFIRATGESVLSDNTTDNANATGDGGFIHLHGGSLALLGQTGFLRAFGSTNGGTVLMTAGLTPNLSPITVAPVDNAAASLRAGIPGFAVGVTALPESVVVGGNIDTRGRGPLSEAVASRLGFTRLGAEQQVGILNTAKLNNVDATTFVNAGTGNLDASAFLASAGNVQAVVGEGAVKAIACGGPLPPVTVVTPPSTDGGTGGFPDGNTDDTGNLFGLFQSQRQIPIDKFANNNANRILLAFAQPNMFLARTYKSVTERILAAALEEYIAAQSSDQTVANTTSTNKASATEQAKRYLLQAGVDSDVAKQLLTQYDAGTLKADPTIVSILKTMADSKTITQ
jgi:hypothetical protein